MLNEAKARLFCGTPLRLIQVRLLGTAGRHTF
jgi:hypothetical protein